MASGEGYFQPGRRTPLPHGATLRQTRRAMSDVGTHGPGPQHPMRMRREETDHTGSGVTWRMCGQWKKHTRPSPDPPRPCSRKTPPTARLSRIKHRRTVAAADVGGEGGGSGGSGTACRWRRAGVIAVELPRLLHLLQSGHETRPSSQHLLHATATLQPTCNQLEQEPCTKRNAGKSQVKLRSRIDLPHVIPT